MLLLYSGPVSEEPVTHLFCHGLLWDERVARVLQYAADTRLMQ
jgi:hypothetical protein